MILTYDNKKTENEILKEDTSFILPKFDMKSNQLFYGDNFPILKALLYQCDLKGKIDLIYIDPPFATNTIFRSSEKRNQTISMSNDDEIAANNQKIQQLITSVPNWKTTTAGSTVNTSTAQYAIFSAKQLITLIESIDTAFDREPFNKKPLVDLVGSSDIPVILMWTDEDNKTRYRSIYNDAAQDRIKALHQGANTTDEERLTYLGDKKVIVDPNKINVQIHYISPGLSKSNRLGKEQYMFAIYIPKDKIYFVKEHD